MKMNKKNVTLVTAVCVLILSAAGCAQPWIRDWLGDALEEKKEPPAPPSQEILSGSNDLLSLKVNGRDILIANEMQPDYAAIGSPAASFQIEAGIPADSTISFMGAVQNGTEATVSPLTAGVLRTVVIMVTAQNGAIQAYSLTMYRPDFSYEAGSGNLWTLVTNQPANSKYVYSGTWTTAQGVPVNASAGWLEINKAGNYCVSITFDTSAATYNCYYDSAMAPTGSGNFTWCKTTVTGDLSLLPRTVNLMDGRNLAYHFPEAPSGTHTYIFYYYGTGSLTVSGRTITSNQTSMMQCDASQNVSMSGSNGSYVTRLN